MFAKDECVLFLVLIFSLVSCSTDINNQNDDLNEAKLTTATLSELYSGYRLEPSDWMQFLLCWYHHQDEDSALVFDFVDAEVSSIADTFSNQRFEEHLPKSLRDFYSAFSALGGSFVKADDTESVGFYAPSSLKTLENYNHELVSLSKDWFVDSPDEEYFRYGTDQDTSTGRTEYLQGAIVIGRYGDSYSEVVLLYPNSMTLDREMEASILSFASEFRAPSFAELMRQISVLPQRETLPPYSQESLIGTCADFLPLENVWWR